MTSYFVFFVFSLALLNFSLTKSCYFWLHFWFRFKCLSSVTYSHDGICGFPVFEVPKTVSHPHGNITMNMLYKMWSIYSWRKAITRSFFRPLAMLMQSKQRIWRCSSSVHVPHATPHTDEKITPASVINITSSFQSRCWIAHICERRSLLYKRGAAMRSLSRFMVGDNELFFCQSLSLASW